MSVRIRGAARQSLFLLVASVGLAAPLVLPASTFAESTFMRDMEFLPGDAAVGPSAGDQTAPAVARGGNQLLAVWVDGSTSDRSDLDIVAARLDASGALLDPTPFPISRDAGFQRAPQVVWNGQSWLVAWENQTFNGSYYETRVFAVRVAPDGQVLDAVPIQPFGEEEGDDFSVTSNGSEWLFVTQSWTAGAEGIRARRIGADGVPIGVAPTVLVAPTYYLYFDVEIHSAQGEYLLTYSGNGGFIGRRYTATLDPLGSVPIPSLRRIVSNGTRYLVIFTAGTFNNEIRVSPMDPNGNLLVPGGTFLADTYTAVWFDVRAAWDGTNWWVAYRHAFTGITYRRVADNGTVIDATGFAIDPANEDYHGDPITVGKPSGGVLTLWPDRRIGGLNPYDIYGARVEGPSSTEPGSPISLGAPRQTYANLTNGPDGTYLVSYRSDRSGQSRVVFQRLDATGSALDGEPVEVAADMSATAPAVAWNGSIYLYTWTANGMVYGRRIAADGTFMDASPVFLMNGGQPDVAALGGQFLVVTTHAPGSPQYRFAYAQRVSATTGQPEGSLVALSQYFAQFAQVTEFAGRWLVTYQRNFTHDDPQSSVEGIFVEADGTAPQPPFVVLYATGGNPEVAVSGDTALFVWRNNSLSNANNYIAARRIAPDGTFLGPVFILSEAPGRQLVPVTAWSGSAFVSVWEDQRNQTSFFDARTEVFGARVEESGTIVDPDGFAVVDAERPVIQPAIASPADGTWLVAASICRSDAPFHGYRIAVRNGFQASTTDAPELAGTHLTILHEPSPNPAREMSTIRFSLANAGPVTLGVYDASGKLVRMLENGEQSAGDHVTTWDGRDVTGRALGQGVYFIALQTGADRHARKVVLTR